MGLFDSGPVGDAWSFLFDTEGPSINTEQLPTMTPEQQQMMQMYMQQLMSQFMQPGPQAPFSFDDYGPEMQSALGIQGVQIDPLTGEMSIAPDMSFSEDYWSAMLPEMEQMDQKAMDEFRARNAGSGFRSTGRLSGEADLTANLARARQMQYQGIMYPQYQKAADVAYQFGLSQTDAQRQEDKWRWGSGQMVDGEFDPTGSPYWKAIMESLNISPYSYAVQSVPGRQSLLEQMIGKGAEAYTEKWAEEL